MMPYDKLDDLLEKYLIKNEVKSERNGYEKSTFYRL